MKLEAWDPDLRTLRDRVREGELDLQPDFQRGKVWPVSKQQRLIDTVLRGWAVPAIHILVEKDQTLAVLDGQQRLNAMLDFVDGAFKVGRFEPYDDLVDELVGLRFDRLPLEVQRRVFNFKVSSYRLYEYSPAEPHELFFRLNLPSGLTQAEKRNALIGDAREQVKDLVTEAHESGWSRESIGFANSRLAYDDTLSRICEFVEAGSVRTPLNVATMERRYRSEHGFSSGTLSTVSKIVVHIGLVRSHQSDPRIPLNKAALLSWSLALARKERNPELSEVDVDKAFSILEFFRLLSRRSAGPRFDLEPRIAEVYALLYADRASLRVTDVLSVVARDVCIWRVASSDAGDRAKPLLNALLGELLALEGSKEFSQSTVLARLESSDSWGPLA